jgi:hypothetical protein
MLIGRGRGAGFVSACELDAGARPVHHVCSPCGGRHVGFSSSKFDMGLNSSILQHHRSKFLLDFRGERSTRVDTSRVRP